MSHRPEEPKAAAECGCKGACAGSSAATEGCSATEACSAEFIAAVLKVVVEGDEQRGNSSLQRLPWSLVASKMSGETRLEMMVPLKNTILFDCHFVLMDLAKLFLCHFLGAQTTEI